MEGKSRRKVVRCLEGVEVGWRILTVCLDVDCVNRR